MGSFPTWKAEHAKLMELSFTLVVEGGFGPRPNAKAACRKHTNF
jgi:hypothetical protein